MTGPFYDELEAGHVFAAPPGLTIDSGLVATYRSICGDHWAPGLDHPLGRSLTGRQEPLAHPGLVIAASIGASTVATRQVIANLFYRGLVLRQPVHLGQTLRTTTVVRALADASHRPGKPLRGKMLLGITTTADDEVVLEYERCALLPYHGDIAMGHDDNIGTSAAAALDFGAYEIGLPSWDLSLLGPHDEWATDETRPDPLRDVVDNATGLVRVTHNLAAIHRDASRSDNGLRLVFGGHTVALAQASLERTVGGLATVLGWHECNHLAPVFEGDLLSFSHTLRAETEHAGVSMRAIQVQVAAHRGDGDSVPVLDWTPVVATS